MQSSRASDRVAGVGISLRRIPTDWLTDSHSHQVGEEEEFNNGKGFNE